MKHNYPTCPDCGAELRPVRLTSLSESMYIEFSTEAVPDHRVMECCCESCRNVYEYQYKPSSGKTDAEFSLLCTINRDDDNIVQSVEYTDLAKYIMKQGGISYENR